MVLEITNKRTGPATEKPGYYYDGNIHSGELTGAEVTLHFAWYLLSNYGIDDRVTQLLDTRVIYIRPKFNPDGADISLNSIENPRSTPRPYDEDLDGLLDEDGRNDLNGDGVFTQMRVKTDTGRWKISVEDPRIMIRREDGDQKGEFYNIYSEGIDDDGDGRFNEDGLGGIDMNRNFPRNWGLESEQRGAGPFPLSEPETRATIEFLNDHRNITGVFHGHTSGGFLFRLPSTIAWDTFVSEDQELIVELSDQYAKTTNQRVIPSYTNPNLHRHGTLISWSYWDFGVVGFVPEFWEAGKDYDGDGQISGLESMRWNDEELGGEGFVNWTKLEHPQLGEVEVGGWKRKFTFQNPPVQFLQSEIEKYVPWMFWLAEISPKVVINNIEVSSLNSKDQMKLSVKVENEGYLPTNLTQRAIDLEIAKPVRVIVELFDATLISGSLRVELGHMNGTRENLNNNSGSTKTADFILKITGDNPSALITVISEKGGTSRQLFDIK